MRPFRKSGGFTLIELIVVIAILSILSSVAVSDYARYLTRVNNAATERFLDELKNHIVLANAWGGPIERITVFAADAKTLLVKVEADTFTQSFGARIEAIFGPESLPEPDEPDNPSFYLFYVPAPATWADSTYGACNWAVYSRSANQWTDQ